MITFDDFLKLDLRIGTILSAERVPEADKLLKVIVDLGDEQRQVMAGIAESVADPASLVGKQTPVLINLEPRKLRGYISEGMLLMTSGDGRPVFLQPEEVVAPGSVIR